MTLRRLRGELEGLFWQWSAPARRALRALRRELALARPRGRASRRVVFDPPRPEGRTAEAPAAWIAPPGAATPGRHRSLLHLVGDLERLDWVGDAAGDLLLRAPETAAGGDDLRGPRLGRVVALPGAAPAPARDRFAELPWERAGEHRMLSAEPSGRRVRRRAASVDGRSAHGAERSPESPPTAILLAPFLAVGGAERLLLAYARAVRERRRLVVVTTERHAPELGETFSALAGLAEHLPLGESVERALHPAALSGIVARHRAEALVAWNGCALFYDQAPALARRFPELRIVNQLFDHRVGWIRRLTPALRSACSATIAVNAPIRDELLRGRGFAAERIALVRHGVERAAPADAAARAALRRELAIPETAVVAASFLRLHPQKRPFDLVEVARRLERDGVWLLLVGGGPLEGELRAALAAAPARNVVWRPLDPNPERLFAAADFALLASAYEGLPIFLLEAMARGLPAVATAAGEIPALLESCGARPAPVGDVDALVARVRELLDPELRAAAGRRARAVVERDFSLERFVRETDAAIFGDSPA